MLLGYQANIDHYLHLLKTKEDLEQFEKESFLLALDPRATSRERREWQRMGGENKVHALRHRQDVQTAKEKLANGIREVQEQCQLHKRRRLGGDCTSMTILGQCARWQPPAWGGT